MDSPWSCQTQSPLSTQSAGISPSPPSLNSRILNRMHSKIFAGSPTKPDTPQNFTADASSSHAQSQIATADYDTETQECVFTSCTSIYLCKYFDRMLRVEINLRLQVDPWVVPSLCILLILQDDPFFLLSTALPVTWTKPALG